jgi:hypothetical protein
MSMPYSANTADKQIMATLARRAGDEVTGAIKKASADTGVNFAYLMEQAAAESSFNPQASADTSSAQGLYQFIDSTWLATVRKHGDKHGMGDYARHINADKTVDDPQMRKTILAMRNDPDKAAAMAAELANDNAKFLVEHTGKSRDELTSTDRYLAHFLGAGKAAGFLNAMEEQPMTAAADLYPDAAQANRAVFYDGGRPKSLAEVYDYFDQKFRAEDAKQQSPLMADASGGTSSQAREMITNATGVSQSDIQTAIAVQNANSSGFGAQSAAQDYLSIALQNSSNSTSRGLSSHLVQNPVEIMMMRHLDEPGASHKQI